MERTMSMASHAVRSEASRAFTQTSDRQHERELGIARRPANFETTSDTSSQRERKFANLLGESDSGSDREAPQGRSVGHRLYHTGCGREKVKQDRLREERERLLMSEMAQMTQRPNITARARSKMSKGQHFADHAAMWSAQRDHHLRIAAQKVANERFAEVQVKPTLNARSEAIIRSSGDYKGPVRHWREHFEKFSARRVRDDAATHHEASFTPNINANAVRVDVERDITDRLYQESAARRERLQQRAYEQQAREMLDAATGRPLFAPHALRSVDVGPPRKAEELSAQLHEDSYEMARKREQAIVQHADPECTFKPTLNESSHILAGKARKPLYVPRAQRVEDERAKRERVQVQRARSAEPTPRQPSATRVSVDDFLRRTQRNETTRAQKLDHIRQEQEGRETRECTFHPAISRRSEEIFFASNVSGTPMRSPLEPMPQTPYAPDRSGVASPTNPSTARMSASPLRLSPKAGTTGARARTAADEFAAVMAASGIASATTTGNVPPTGQARRSPRVETASAYHEMDDAKSPAPLPPRPTTPRGISPAAGTGSAGGGIGDVDQYIAAFESQMYSVLEEWRKLEEV
jgi:hypothetical protein